MASLRVGCWAGLLLLCSALTTIAEAQIPAGVTLDWNTSSECTRPLDLEWQVARLLDPGLTLAEPLSFLARVDGLPAGRHALTLSVTRAGKEVTRHVELASCAETRDAVALLVAITIDPNAVSRAREQTPSDAAAPAPLTPLAPAGEADAEQPVPDAPTASTRPPSSPRRVATDLTVGAIGDLQSLPDPSIAPTLGVELAIGRLRTGVEAHYFAPRYAESDIDGVEARVELAAGTIGVAYMPNFGAIGFGPRFAAELGYLRVVGIGVDDRRTTGAFWAAALAGARLDYTVHPRVRLRLGIDLGIPLRRARFALAPSPVFYQTSAITGRVEVGLLIRVGSGL